jgi:hypothetical protein
MPSRHVMDSALRHIARAVCRGDWREEWLPTDGTLWLGTQTAFHSGNQPFKFVEGFSFPFEFEQGLEFRADLGKVQLSMLADQDPFDVAPIQTAPCESLMSEEILGRTGRQHDASANLPRCRSRNAPLLEWKGAERDVHVHACARFGQQDAAAQSELAGIRTSWIQFIQQGVNEVFLITEPG